MVTALVPAFVIVNGLVALARSGRLKLEHEWAERGARDLAAGRAGDAADDYYAAQAYARDRGRYRLDLSHALIAAGRTNEECSVSHETQRAQVGSAAAPRLSIVLVVGKASQVKTIFFNR